MGCKITSKYTSMLQIDCVVYYFSIASMLLIVPAQANLA